VMNFKIVMDLLHSIALLEKLPSEVGIKESTGFRGTGVPPL
jgi:hypothetical protein